MTSHYEEITAVDAEERAQEFRLALQDPDRLADALARSRRHFAISASSFASPSRTRTPLPCFFGASPTGNGSISERSILRIAGRRFTRFGTRREVTVKVTDDMTAAGPPVQDASLTGWLNDLVDFLCDMAVLVFSTRAPEAYDTTRMYDLCHRFTLRTEGLDGHKLFPSSVRLLGGLFTPSLQRIPPLPMEKSFAIIVGDSSLALVDMKGQRVVKKRSFGDELQVALRNEPRCTGSEVAMLWGQPGGSKSVYALYVAMLCRLRNVSMLLHLSYVTHPSLICRSICPTLRTLA